MKYLTVPYQGVVLADNGQQQQQLVQGLQQKKSGDSTQASPVFMVSDEQQAVIDAPPATGGPWALCQDQEGRMFWLNDNTGQWTYHAGASAAQIMQPPPPPQYMYVSQVAQPQPNTAWVVSPSTSPPQQQQQQQQMVWVPVGVSPAPSDVDNDTDDDEGGAETPSTSTSKSKVVYPGLPTWEECWNADGKIVWIHRETGKLVHTDPYE